MFSRHWLHGGRRRVCRRLHERECSFVDLYGTLLFLMVTLVATMNVLDAFFTVLFLSHGGTEVNPVVDASLSAGLWLFLLIKSLGIGFCVLFLTLTKNFRLSRLGLQVVLWGYLALISWHAVLYLRLPSEAF